MTSEIQIALDPGAAALLDRLHQAGYAAYAVGGCVRDSLLGLSPHDWDLCTSATPEETLALFGEKQCIPTGLQHGTITVKWKGKLYETTTFRTEGTYSDGRHPDHVEFVPDVKEDLARRDFTINAMAYSAEEGLIDPFGGRDDLGKKIVRAVGEPKRRFEEDALRILRLYRFAARFGFAVEPATGQAAKNLCRHLDCVSAERIAEELTRLLAAPKPGAYLEADILAVVIPELDKQTLPELRDVIDRLEPGTEAMPTRLAALLLPLGEDGAKTALKRLKCSNALMNTVTTLVCEVRENTLLPRSRIRRAGSFSEDRPLGWDPVAEGNRAGDGMDCNGNDRRQRREQGVAVGAAASGMQGPISGQSIRWEPQPVFVSEKEAPDSPGKSGIELDTKRLLGRYGLEIVEQLNALCGALCPERAADFAAQAALARQLDAAGVCCRVSQLAVNGRDLMAAGIQPGPGLRRVLEALLEQVLTGQTPNEKNALLHAAAEFSAS